MKKDEWVNRSIEERKEWYIDKINQLLDALEHDDTAPKARNEYLKITKMRMAYDNTPSKERTVDTEESYYQTIYKAYKTLPNFEQKQDDWPSALNEVLDILAEFDN